MALDDAVPNADTTRSTRLQCLAAITAYQLPDIEVPDDMELVIKNDPRNPIAPVATIIQIAPNAPSALNIDQSWPLVVNEAINYRVKNANSLYVSSNLAATFVDITVEERKKKRG